MGNNSLADAANGLGGTLQADRQARSEQGLRAHAASSCYSLVCNCQPNERRQDAVRHRAYAYLRRHLLICQPEVSRTKERLGSYAAGAGLELAAIFVEEDGSLCLSAFARFLEATIRDEVTIVLLPSMLHLTVLGAPNSIKQHFEAAAGARVVTIA